MAERALADLTPAEVLQVALDESTTEQRCDEAWVAALAARVRAARTGGDSDGGHVAECAARLRATEPTVYASAWVDMSDLHVVLAEYDRRGAEMQRSEAMLALLRHYLIKVTSRVGRSDLAKQVWSSTPIGDVEHVGEEVLAELERQRARVTELEAIEPSPADVRMESPTSPDWGGEYTDDGRQLYHHAWDSTDGTLRLWVGPYAAGQPEPSWAVTVRAAGADVVMRCTPAEIVEWADEVKAAIAASAVLVGSEPDVSDVRVVCGDVSGPDGGVGECVLPPGHPHVDGIGGQWPAVPDGEDGATPAVWWSGTSGLLREVEGELCGPQGVLGALPGDAVRLTAVLVHDAEDVPARLNAAADSFAKLGLPYCARLMRELADATNVAHPDVRAAVAAALARPAQPEEQDRG